MAVSNKEIRCISAVMTITIVIMVKIIMIIVIVIILGHLVNDPFVMQITHALRNLLCDDDHLKFSINGFHPMIAMIIYEEFDPLIIFN